MSAKNSVKIIGRVTRDVAVSGEDNKKIARTTVAVPRNFKNADGNYDSDFISIVAFGKQAEFLEKYFPKGKPIIIDGSIRTGSYTNKDGQKVYTTDVVVESVDFTISDKGDANETPIEEPKEEKKAAKKKEEKKKDPDEDFMNIEPGDMEELPW